MRGWRSRVNRRTSSFGATVEGPRIEGKARSEGAGRGGTVGAMPSGWMAPISRCVSSVRKVLACTPTSTSLYTWRELRPPAPLRRQRW
jgi:hypothetical protein